MLLYLKISLMFCPDVPKNLHYEGKKESFRCWMCWDMSHGPMPLTVVTSTGSTPGLFT